MQGMVVYIPNRTLLSEKFENISRRRYFVQTWKVSIPRDIPSDTVREMLEKIREKIGEFYPRGFKRELTDMTSLEHIYTFSAEWDSEDQESTKEVELYIMGIIREASRKFPRKAGKKKESDASIEAMIQSEEWY